MRIINTKINLTKKDFLERLDNFEGKEQYLFATFNHDIEDVLTILEENNDEQEHVSGNYRLIEDVVKNSNSFQLNDSRYDWKPYTNIYLIQKTWCDYYVLHDTKNNNIVVYENIL